MGCVILPFKNSSMEWILQGGWRGDERVGNSIYGEFDRIPIDGIDYGKNYTFELQQNYMS